MKSGWSLIGIVAIAFMGGQEAYAAHSLTQVWKTEGLAVPESVIHINDPKEPYLLVSLIDGEPAATDGKGGIAKLAGNSARLMY